MGVVDEHDELATAIHMFESPRHSGQCGKSGGDVFLRHTKFGCGGGRDASKRAEMGAASCLADAVVVTSDNPRNENPQAIVDAIVSGVPADERRKVTVEVDRRRAIEHACANAEPGDVVVIAGRGHETMQSIAGTDVPFNDADVARSVLGVAR